MATISKTAGITGSVSVAQSPAEILPDSLVIDMREEISMADEDESQFTTYTMKLKHSEATREKINWREKDYFPRLSAVQTAYTAISTTGTIVVTATQGNRFRKGDVVRNMAGKDAFLVTSVSSDTLSVTHIGAATAAAGSVGDTLLIAGNASEQGADYPDTAVLTATLGYNYTQIFRHGCVFSRTARAVNYYGQSEPAQEEALKGIEQKRAIEYTGFWGARGLIAPGPITAGGGEPLGLAGGLVEFIVTNKVDMSIGGFTVDTVDDFLRNALQHASTNVVIFCAPIVAQRMSKFNRGGQGTAWRPSNESVAGLKVDAFMSGVYGYEIPIVVKKDWNDFPSTLKQYGGWAFVVDLNRVEYKTLTGGSTSLLENRQSPGADKKASEWLTECTWEIRNEASHGIMYGVT